MILFPVCLFEFMWKDYSTHKQDLIDYCYELEEVPMTITVAAGSKQSLFESKFNFLRTPRPSIKALTDFFYQSLWEVVTDMNGHIWRDSKKAMLIHESWCHITRTGGYHDVHRHGACSWCGIFYLDKAATDKETRNGVNRFYNDILNLGADEGNLYMESYIDAEPEDGKLIIFPSHMLHSALAYVGDTPRIVIAFNAQVKNRDQDI